MYAASACSNKPKFGQSPKVNIIFCAAAHFTPILKFVSDEDWVTGPLEREPHPHLLCRRDQPNSCLGLVRSHRPMLPGPHNVVQKTGFNPNF